LKGIAFFVIKKHHKMLHKSLYESSWNVVAWCKEKESLFLQWKLKISNSFGFSMMCVYSIFYGLLKQQKMIDIM
jgi:hypothetical protein